MSKYKNIKNIKVLNQDALTYNYSIIEKPKTIISNLPYNISIKLIINWLKTLSEYNEIIVMIQKEVAQKMQYKNNKKRNRLNTLTEIASNFNIMFDVSQNVFYPKPKVMSSVVHIKQKYGIRINLEKLENFTREIFKYKRKKISNVLSMDRIKNKKKIKDLNILNLRAEDLSLQEIVEIFSEYSQL